MIVKRSLSLFRRLIRSADGATAVEFALVVPVFLSFCLGTFEFGRMLWVRNSLQTATEEASRYAMTHTTATDAQLIDQASNYFNSLGTGAATFTIVRDTTNSVGFVTVNGAYGFRFLFPFLDYGTVQLAGKSRAPLIS
jgi:Flp pilus assembly protein TadG